MPNVNAPFGFRQIGLMGGSVTPSFGMITRKIASSDTTKIFHGDPVKNLATGYVAQWTPGTEVSQLAGIFVGCEYLSTSLGRVVWSPFWPGADAAADPMAYLVPCNLSPAPLFLVQSSGNTTQADIGANADVILGTGNTRTGLSGATINQATIASTATFPFRIMGLYEGVGPGSDASSNFNWVVVAANVTGSTGI